MPETIQQIASTLAQQIEAWLKRPDEASLGLQELRERLGALRGSIGAGATSDALRAISGVDRNIRATRQRQAADAIAAACREVGVILEPRPPLKRAPRKKRNTSATPPLPVLTGEGARLTTQPGASSVGREE